MDWVVLVFFAPRNFASGKQQILLGSRDRDEPVAPIPLQLQLGIGAAALTHEPTLCASNPIHPAGKSGWTGPRRGGKGCGWDGRRPRAAGRTTVCRPQVPGCHLMVTKAAAGLPPTSAGTSLILAEKHQGSHQENVPADEADKLQPGGRGRRGLAFWGGRWAGDNGGIGGMPSSPSSCLVPQFPHRALRAQAAAHVWVSAGTPLPPAGALIRAEWDDLILWEMSLKTDQAADETPYCCGEGEGDGGTATSAPRPAPCSFPCSQ